MARGGQLQRGPTRSTGAGAIGALVLGWGIVLGPAGAAQAQGLAWQMLLNVPPQAWSEGKTTKGGATELDDRERRAVRMGTRVQIGGTAELGAGIRYEWGELEETSGRLELRARF